ncbi:hypothetical protein BH10PLA1_BH10PLA1_07400 [soil metagenome]
MRKDVKLGFAIGGVLLAVAIVFALVNSSHTKVKDEVVDATADTMSTDASDADAGKTDANTAAEVKPEPAAKVATSGSTKTDATAATNDQTGLFNSTPAAATNGAAFSSTDWDQSMKTGVIKTNTPVMAATSGGPMPDAIVDHTPTPAVVGPVHVNAPGVSFVSHAQQGDADEAVKGSTVTLGTPVGGPPTAVIARQATSHTIKNGETFSTIAAVYYGNAKYHKLISAANPKVDPTHLKIGTVITLPALDAKADSTKSAAASHTTSDEKAIDAKTQYRVRSGDNLHRICVKLYGDPKQVDALYDLNKSAIGTDPAKLKLGMILKLPSAPTVAAK